MLSQKLVFCSYHVTKFINEFWKMNLDLCFLVPKIVLFWKFLQLLYNLNLKFIWLSMYDQKNRKWIVLVFVPQKSGRIICNLALNVFVHKEAQVHMREPIAVTAHRLNIRSRQHECKFIASNAECKEHYIY